MVFDVIIGRSKEDVEKYGKKGTVLIAKQYVKMGQTTSLSNPVYLDVAGAHVVFIVGKRGTGKSYTMGSIAEGLADLPLEIKQNLAIILIDTMGIYWTMKYPNYKDAEIVKEWGYEPKWLDVKIYTPSGFYYKYQEEGIPTDFPFSIRPLDVSPNDWCNAFSLDPNSAEGVLITKVVQHFLKQGTSYDLDAMIDFVRNDSESDKVTKGIIINEFDKAKGWEIFSKEGIREKYLMEIAASLEKLSEHPLSKAIVEKAKLSKYKEVKNFKILRGRGVEGKIGMKNILIGNSTLMKERNISLSDFENKINEFEEKGYTAIIVSEDKKILGIIGVADAVKDDSIESIAKLNKQGYRTIMITGDNQKTAKAIASQVGIKEIIANVLPEDKVKKVEELQKQGMVSFIGDGINDAPAIKQSNVGIAMGTGTDIAIESGDLVLAKGSLNGVVQAINLSKATFKKIKQNLFWAFAYNTIAIPLAIAGVLHPVVAEIAMALSSITVVTNANLLRRKKID